MRAARTDGAFEPALAPAGWPADKRLESGPVFPGLRQVQSSRCHVDSQRFYCSLTLRIRFAQPAPQRRRHGLSNGGVGAKDIQADHGSHPKSAGGPGCQRSQLKRAG